jgi:Ribbon-helix-helix domain
MKSPVVKRSVVIAGHKTSVSLEDAFAGNWFAKVQVAWPQHRFVGSTTGRSHADAICRLAEILK